MASSNAGNAEDDARYSSCSAKFLGLLISTTYGDKSIGRRAAPKAVYPGSSPGSRVGQH